jgi:hypothetical protein
MEFHRRNTYGSNRVLHGPLVRLIHEIPNINSTIRLTDEADSCSAWTPASRSMEAAFADHTGEERHIDVVLPDAEMEVIDGENDALV